MMGDDEISKFSTSVWAGGTAGPSPHRAESYPGKRQFWLSVGIFFSLTLAPVPAAEMVCW